MTALVQRILAAAVLVVTVGWSTAVTANTEPGGTPVMLRDQAVVSDDHVRLGDLFVGAGPRADTAVARAPAPGRRAVFDARWLFRVARAFGLHWRPISTQDRVVVIRDSVVVDNREIEDRLLAALAEHGTDIADMQIALANPMLRLHVATNKAGTIGVENLVVDPRSRRFTAVIATSPPATRRHYVPTCEAACTRSFLCRC